MIKNKLSFILYRHMIFYVIFSVCCLVVLGYLTSNENNAIEIITMIGAFIMLALSFLILDRRVDRTKQFKLLSAIDVVLRGVAFLIAQIYRLKVVNWLWYCVLIVLVLITISSLVLQLLMKFKLKQVANQTKTHIMLAKTINNDTTLATDTMSMDIANNHATDTLNYNKNANDIIVATTQHKIKYGVKVATITAVNLCSIWIAISIFLLKDSLYTVLGMIVIMLSTAVEYFIYKDYTKYSTANITNKCFIIILSKLIIASIVWTLFDQVGYVNPVMVGSAVAYAIVLVVSLLMLFYINKQYSKKEDIPITLKLVQSPQSLSNIMLYCSVVLMCVIVVIGNLIGRHYALTAVVVLILLEGYVHYCRIMFTFYYKKLAQNYKRLAWQLALILIGYSILVLIMPCGVGYMNNTNPTDYYYQGLGIALIAHIPIFIDTYMYRNHNNKLMPKTRID